MSSALSGLLDIRQLRAFEALARLGSFTEAAREIFVTQSAVSHSLKSLEEALGCQLVERQGRRITLTEQGRVLLRRTSRALEEIRQASEEVSDIRQWGRGRLRIGATASMTQSLLPPVLREFRESFPQADIMVETGDTLDMLRRLQEGHIQMVLGVRAEHMEIGQFVPLFQDQLQFVFSPFHPWAARPEISPQDFLDARFIVYVHHSQTHRLTQSFLERAGQRPSDTLQVGSTEGILQLAKVGIGVAIMAPWAAADEIRSGTLLARPIPGEDLTREWGVYLPARHRQTLAEETFLGICEIVAQDLEWRP